MAQQGLQALMPHLEALAVLPIQSFLPKALPLPHVGERGVSRAYSLQQTIPGSGLLRGPRPHGSPGVSDTEEKNSTLLVSTFL